MSQSLDISPDWTSYLLVDILRYHVAPTLYGKTVDAAVCRLVCTAWRAAFVLPHLVVTPELIHNDSEDLKRSVQQARSLKLTEAVSSALQWLTAIATPGSNFVSLSLTFPGIFRGEASSLSTLLGVRLPHLRTLKLYSHAAPLFIHFRLIAEALGDTPNSLETLDLAGCGIGDECATALLTALRRNSTIRRLSLSQCGLSRDSHDILLDFMKENRTVTDLILKSNDALLENHDSFPQRFCEVLASDTTLRTLDLSRINVPPQIFDALKQNSTLQELKLVWCQIPAVNLVSLLAALENNRCLRKLTAYADSFDAGAVQAIGKTLKSNTTLQKMHLDGSRFFEVNFGPAFDGLAQNTSLRSLNVDPLNVHSMESLVEFLEQHGAQCSLTKLALYLPETELHIVRVVRALSLLPRLQTLDFKLSPLGPDSAEPLAVMIARTTSLTDLRFSRLRVGDAGFIRLCAAVGQSSTLRRLDVGEDSYGEVVFPHVFDMITRSPALEDLEFSGTLIPVKHKPLFEQAVKSSRLKHFGLTFLEPTGMYKNQMNLVEDLQKRS
eukprot:TRINITY_DN848_c0_g2_i1.p1 TRINITY_DN848_c0_g2~~TRINITY_DN848_c0_g2_i1.p1  ORF type:complete len:552 (-),score=44.38 TRINITY_DN848_c0_g2_i1:688-2343(-)